MNAFPLNIRHFAQKAFNTSVLKKKRLEWVDYLKGIAILLVVYRHVLIGIERGHIYIPTALVDANMIFYSFRMPLFFILSGIFISRSLAKRPVKNLVENKFELLLYPYLVWTFIQVTLQIALSKITNSDRTLIDYTYILYQPRNLDQFWYLPALFNTTVIYVLLKTKLKLKTWMQLAIGTLFYFMSYYFQQISMLSDWMEFYLFFAIGDATAKLFFKESTQRFLRNKWALALVIPVFVVTQLHYLHHDIGIEVLPQSNSHSSRLNLFKHITEQIDFLWVAGVGCFSMIVLAFRLAAWNVFSFLRVIGYHSLQIYVMHVIVTAFVRLSLIILFHIHDAPLLLTICITAGVIAPVAFYNLAIKDGFAWFLFSYKHKKPVSQPAPAPEPMPEVLHQRITTLTE